MNVTIEPHLNMNIICKNKKLQSVPRMVVPTQMVNCLIQDKFETEFSYKPHL